MLFYLMRLRLMSSHESCGTRTGMWCGQMLMHITLWDVHHQMTMPYAVCMKVYTPMILVALSLRHLVAAAVALLLRRLAAAAVACDETNGCGFQSPALTRAGTVD